MQTEDGYIIRKCLNGEKEAFGLLVDKYKEGIYLLAYGKLRNFQDAEDVTQEVFIKIYRKLHSLRRWDNVMAWIYAVTSNTCKDWIRSQSRQRDRESIADQAAAPLANPSMNSYRENLVFESLHEALDSLPLAYQQALTLHYFSGMKVMEIARLLGTSPSTIARRLREAKAQLREEMLEMMSATYQQQKLPLGFTFHIAEAVKRIRIRPIPHTAVLPWGISLAAGIILPVLSIGSHLNPADPIVSAMYSPPRSESAESGEMPVDVLKASEMLVMSGDQAPRNSGEPQLPLQHNAPLLAPRGEGDRFPEEPAAVLGESAVESAAYSPNGKLIAIGGGAGVWLHRADDLAEIGLLEGHTGTVKSLTFSPDSKILASGGSDGTIRIWDVEGQAETAVLRGHTGYVLSLSFGLDGKMLVSGGGYTVNWANDDERMVRVWDVEQKKQIAALNGHDRMVRSVSFSPDGKLVASGSSDNIVRVWDVEQKKAIALLEGAGGDDSVSFSPDGELLAFAGWERGTRLWSVKDKTEVALLSGVPPVTFSPDGRLVANRSREDGSIQIWDVETQEKIAALEGSAFPKHISFSPDGKRLVSVTWSLSTVQVWDIEEEKEAANLSYTGYVNSVSFSPDGTFGGTSAACPHVAATAALVLAQFGPQSPGWVKSRLIDTAEWLNGPTEYQQGAGLVNAEAAVLGSSSAPPLYTFSPKGKLSTTWGELKAK